MSHRGTWRAPALSVTSTRGHQEESRRATVLDELDGLVPVPALLVRSIAVTVHVCGAGALRRSSVHTHESTRAQHTADCPRLPEHAAAKRNVVHARADLLIPAADDDPGRERVLVLIAELLEERRSGVNGRRTGGLPGQGVSTA
jgi:hypothetical protein